MVAETTIRKIGNSQGITIPKEMCDSLDLPLGQKVRLSSDASGIHITPAKGRTLRERLTEWDGKRYAAPEIDWGAPAGSEVW